MSTSTNSPGQVHELPDTQLSCKEKLINGDNYRRYALHKIKVAYHALETAENIRGHALKKREEEYNDLYHAYQADTELLRNEVAITRAGLERAYLHQKELKTTIAVLEGKLGLSPPLTATKVSATAIAAQDIYSEGNTRDFASAMAAGVSQSCGSPHGVREFKEQEAEKAASEKMEGPEHFERAAEMAVPSCGKKRKREPKGGRLGRKRVRV